MIYASIVEIHSVGTINNVETSYFTQLKICYLMTTFRLSMSVGHLDCLQLDGACDLEITWYHVWLSW